MSKRKTKIIVTIGPATNTVSTLRKIKDQGVDFVRTNMSHSSLDDLKRCLDLAREVDIPFVLDTEGSQVRTGGLEEESLHFAENESVTLWNTPIKGNKEKLCLRPPSVLGQLDVGDLIHIDFDTLILRVADVSTASEGYVTARAIAGGYVGRNKAVVIDPVFSRHLQLPALSEKDYGAIDIALEAGVEHIAVSFVRSGAAVDDVREATKHKMKIISKVECIDALENIDDIIEKSDFLLIDRGDLSKEIPIERIPFAQKVIIKKARDKQTGAFVATNLLETMIEKRKPTRAEVHDIANTIVDGAVGLTLAAETAIGKYPIECVNMLNTLISHTEAVLAADICSGWGDGRPRNGLIERLADSGYLTSGERSSFLNPAHGGHLVNRVAGSVPEAGDLAGLPKVHINDHRWMEVEQIAIGTFSPLEGFLDQKNLQSVLTDMRLASGVVWPLPILLDVSEDEANKLAVGQDVGLVDDRGDVVALLHLEEKYALDHESIAEHIYGTRNPDHPGVRRTLQMKPIALAGPITLLKHANSPTRAYELSPRQVRRLFEERGWVKIVGFHTRNVIHKGHEFIQMRAMEQEHCDGLFIHPVVGERKAGDFASRLIVKSYEKMIDSFYPPGKVLLAAFATFSRYAGPREALFTALCRKNFGCTHFIVGRDHTGVGEYYDPYAAHKIFDQFPDLGITPIKFDEVFYSPTEQQYVHAAATNAKAATDKASISGGQMRDMLRRGETPPHWFMRPEIWEILAEAVAQGEEVFVEPS